MAGSLISVLDIFTPCRETAGFSFISNNSERPPMRGSCENNPIHMGYFLFYENFFKLMNHNGLRLTVKAK
jgi:hypothetical protein